MYNNAIWNQELYRKNVRVNFFILRYKYSNDVGSIIIIVMPIRACIIKYNNVIISSLQCTNDSECVQLQYSGCVFIIKALAW